jgi:enoyl-CoA hydratase
MLFTGRKVKADEAFAMGLADRLAEPEELMEVATALMKQILKNAPIAVKVCKQLVNQGVEKSLADGLVMEAELNGMLAETEDAKEGVRAFFEKRSPVFRNQ